MNSNALSNVLTYGGVVLSAILMALVQAAKSTSEMSRMWPSLANDAIWSYLPILLLTLVGLVWLARQIQMFVKGDKNTGKSRQLPKQATSANSPSNHLYVGRIGVGTNDLAEDQCIELGILGFNGLDQILTVTSISGNTVVKLQADQEWTPLPPPSLKNSFERKVSPAKEFQVVIEQRLPKKFVGDFTVALDTTHGVVINMESVEIGLFNNVQPDRLIRLPIWSHIRLRRTTDFVLAMQDIHASLNATVLTSAGPSA